jgi:hypothetical protein
LSFRARFQGENPSPQSFRSEAAKLADVNDRQFHRPPNLRLLPCEGVNLRSAQAQKNSGLIEIP